MTRLALKYYWILLFAKRKHIKEDKEILTLKKEANAYWCSSWIISIRKTKQGTFLAVLQGDDLEDTQGNTEREVPAEFVNDILSSLATATIVPFPKMRMGNDGCFVTLEVGDYTGKASYRWWTRAPDTWKPLATVANKIKGLFPETLL